MSHPKLWASGWYAYEQLGSVGEAWGFKPVVAPGPASEDTDDLDIFYSAWSITVLKQGSRIHSLGYYQFTLDTAIIADKDTELRNAFGNDVLGLIGCLDSRGRVFLLDIIDVRNKKAILAPASDAEAPPISHLAIAGNGRVALTFKQAPNARLTHIAEFTSFDTFRKWHENPSDADNYPSAHHMLPGRPKQLLANGANFILLTEDGDVYTWGDPRFRTLARPISGTDATPADKPGQVEALGGLKIASIQCAQGVGWLASALSEDGALYLWGSCMPGEDGVIQCLREAGPGEVALVDILPEHEGAEPLDIVSAGVGRNHVAVVTSDGQLFVVGDNNSGQLGLGQQESFVEEWSRVAALPSIERVVAGPQALFAFLR